MGATQPTSGTIPVLQQVAHDAFSALYNDLDKAYWAASNEDKDRIADLKSKVAAIVTALNAADIKSRTADYNKLTANLDAINKEFEALKKDLDKIVHDVTLASDIVKGIDAAVNAAARFIK
jgi:chromosome segregation ATPase